jgi:glutamine amidotransferase
MGICLGMQMLFERSYEYGVHEGLGLIKGEIKPLVGDIPSELKIPHMGWNKLDFVGEKDEIFKYLGDNDFVYFVHSYYGVGCEESLIATSEYGKPITAAVRSGNVWGCQFHPEKSGKVGLAILKAFCEI